MEACVENQWRFLKRGGRDWTMNRRDRKVTTMMSTMWRMTTVTLCCAVLLFLVEGRSRSVDLKGVQV